MLSPISSRGSCLLRQLPPSCAGRYAPLLAHCPRLELAAGGCGPPLQLSRSMLLVVEEGIAVVVAHRGGAGRRMVVAIARPGDVLAAPGPDQQLAALTDLVLTAVSPLACRALLASPEIAALLVERLLEAICQRQESLAVFANVDHGDRIRQKLLQLARAHGRVSTDGVHFDLPLTHELLAQTTGSARETVTCALAELRRQGFIIREGRRYRLTIPPDTLASRAPTAAKRPAGRQASGPVAKGS